eukprot:TRINITY_DN4554_c1_g1_i2.p1 TRINITY_DN4554_c1_g1~~TRINITY_DN4554_c1_g1_i2.p1  ORF type:complete len:171 (-),score=72.81 TRINITY_DN4554_c1_g1_i2:241-753(-)
MLVGTVPFLGNSIDEVFNKVRNLELIDPTKWNSQDEEPVMSETAWNLITKLICEPSQRWGRFGANQIKMHEFFKIIDWNSLRQLEPPFVPQLNSEVDTYYFECNSEQFLDFTKEPIFLDSFSNDRDENNLNGITSPPILYTLNELNNQTNNNNNKQNNKQNNKNQKNNSN